MHYHNRQKICLYTKVNKIERLKHHIILYRKLVTILKVYPNYDWCATYASCM